MRKETYNKRATFWLFRLLRCAYILYFTHIDNSLFPIWWFALRYPHDMVPFDGIIIILQYLPTTYMHIKWIVYIWAGRLVRRPRFFWRFSSVPNNAHTHHEMIFIIITAAGVILIYQISHFFDRVDVHGSFHSHSLL